MAIQGRDILTGLGGADNIIEIEACITRVRTIVRDTDAVDRRALQSAGATDVVLASNVVQVVVGTDAEQVAAQLQALL